MGSFTKLRWKPLRRHNHLDSPSPEVQSCPSRDQARSKRWKTTVDHISSWPKEAKPLNSHSWISYLYMVADVVLVLLPVYFILLAGAVINLNGKATKDNTFGPRVEFAISLNPTLFPIVFAAISGRSLKMVARYLAEKGATLGTLELLMASQSVWGTIESQLFLQRLTLVGANLLFLWALSPIGGQASLRLMKRGDRATESLSKLRYMSTGPAGTLWGLATTYEDNGKFADAAALYSAALMAPLTSKLGHQDPWGNIKIPSLGAYNLSGINPKQWFDLPATTSLPETYSSLVGLPIVGLPSIGSSSFALETSYLTVNCGSFKKNPYPNTMDSDYFTRLEELVPGQVWYDKSSIKNPLEPRNRSTSFFMDTDRPTYLSFQDPDDGVYLSRLSAFLGATNRSLLENGNDTVREPRSLLFASLYPSGDEDTGKYVLNVAKCEISQKHVESMVRCSKGSCRTECVRESLSDDRPSNFTGLEHELMMYGLIQNFPVAVASDAGFSTATERFLANSSSYPFVQQNGNPTSKEVHVDLSLIPPDIFSRRLSLLLNTYYQLSIQPVGYFGSLSGNLSLYGPDTRPVTDIDAYLPANMSTTSHSIEEWWWIFSELVRDTSAPFVGATTMANVTTTDEIFVCNGGWLAVLFASSSIIFLTGVAALVLKRRTLGPELFGFVTSMTYENPYIRIPEGGSTLDAMERARLLKDMQVFVGDVRGDRDVGHIALAAGVSLRELERGRLYS